MADIKGNILDAVTANGEGNEKMEVRDMIAEGVLPKLNVLRNEVPNDFTIDLYCEEFSSCCPLIKQPDYGTIMISYVPDKWIVETKSLKNYIKAWREVSAYQEEILNQFYKDFNEACAPKSLKVEGDFKSRGGIREYITATLKEPK